MQDSGKKKQPDIAGVIAVDKPQDITSAKAVACVKRLLNARKVGHAGTLDPFAQGVLVCCINEATRLARFLLAGDKIYEATLKLGIETDTQDSTGTVTAERQVVDYPDGKIRSVIKQFEGVIEQQPPVFSALKHKGTPLYKLARKGSPVQKPARKVHISSIKILEIKLPLVHFKVCCSAGTYIRTLCADMGRQLGCGGHLLALKRLESSGFNIQQAISLPALEKLASSGQYSRFIVSMADALPDIPAVVADQNLIEKIRHGKPLTKKDLNFDPGFAKRNTHAANIKVVDAGNRLLAILNFLKNQDKFSYACVFPNE
ncbi:MAG: tRNA pseudouridine(55) synthase TruB, partial [Desulfobacterales bacterium]|jgi:tRNA pseudouridine55 synthase